MGDAVLSDVVLSEEKQSGISEYMESMTDTSMMSYHEEFAELESPDNAEEQVLACANYDDDYIYSMEDMLDEFNELERQKEETEREKSELCRRLDEAKRQNSNLRKDQMTIEAERDRALSDLQIASYQNKYSQREALKSQAADDRDQAGVQDQLVMAKLDLAETLQNKDQLMNENIKMRRRVAKMREHLREAQATVMDEKHKYAKTIGEIKMKLAQEQASREDLEIDLQHAIAEKTAVQKEFLETVPRRGSLYFPANR